MTIKKLAKKLRKSSVKVREDILEIDKGLLYIDKHTKHDELFELMKKLASLDYNSTKIQTALEYLQADSGWMNTYTIKNHCNLKCKQSVLDWMVRHPKEFQNTLSDIFLNEKYGKVSIFIFAYSLYSSFTSIKRSNSFSLPYYTQIVAKKGSKLINLINRLMEITDVNLGIGEVCCNNNVRPFKACSYTNAVVYPSSKNGTTMKYLRAYKDVPVLVDGLAADSNRAYRSLINAVSNSTWENKMLLVSTPLFLANEDTNERFSNIMTVDMQDIIVDDDYFNKIKNGYVYLSALVYEHITKFEFKGTKEFYDMIDFRKANISSVMPYLNSSDDIQLSLLYCVFRNFIISAFKSCNDNADDVEIDASETIQKLCDGSLENSSFKNMSLKNKLLIEAMKAFVYYQKEFSPNVDRFFRNISIEIPKDMQYRATSLRRAFSQFRVRLDITKAQNKTNFFVYEIDHRKTTQKKIENSLEDVAAQEGLKEISLIRNKHTHKFELLIPKDEKTSRSLLELFEEKDVKRSNALIPIVIGSDYLDNPVIGDIAFLQHLMLCGSTGSGKSNSLLCIALSIIEKTNPEKVKLMLIDLDYKVFNGFNGIRHLITNTITTAAYAKKAVKAICNEMDKRAELNDEELAKRPYYICIIDEYPKLILKTDSELEKSIEYLLNNSRKYKIFLIITTQNPTNETVSTTMKINILSHLTFKVNSVQKSISVIGEKGAEGLEGRGDMIFKDISNKIVRLQGAFITDEEVKKYLDNKRDEYGESIDIYDILTDPELSTDEETTRLCKALLIILGMASPSSNSFSSKNFPIEVSNIEVRDAYLSSKNKKDYHKYAIENGILMKGDNTNPPTHMIDSYEQLSAEIKTLFSDNKITKDEVDKVIEKRKGVVKDVIAEPVPDSSDGDKPDSVVLPFPKQENNNDETDD